MPIDAALRAERTWLHIQRWPSQIVLTRPAVITDDEPSPGPTALPSQTVRVTKDNRPRALRGEMGEGAELHCVVFGVRDHATLPDTDIERGDTFVLDGDAYVVDYVNLVPGGKQAVCVLQGVGI